MRRAVWAAVLACALAGSAGAQAPRPQGYLPAGAVDSLALVPPPPATGSPALAADQAAFRASRGQEGSARWAQAIAEDKVMPPAGLAHFHCALGAKVDANNAPALTTLMTRVLLDAVALADPVKTRYARARPFVQHPTARVCLPQPPGAKPSGSYPSSHAVVGWAWALILTEMAPGRSNELLRRGREFGENRAICGLHYDSDIEAGRTLGAALVARLHAESAFTADLIKGKAEVAAARVSSPHCGG